MGFLQFLSRTKILVDTCPISVVTDPPHFRLIAHLEWILPLTRYSNPLRIRAGAPLAVVIKLHNGWFAALWQAPLVPQIYSHPVLSIKVSLCPLHEFPCSHYKSPCVVTLVPFVGKMRIGKLRTIPPHNEINNQYSSVLEHCLYQA